MSRHRRPNTVDMNSWAVSACYPRSITFYPLSDGPSIQNHRITKTYFSYLLDVSLSQSSALLPLYSATDFDRSERTFVLLRSLGGDRPSQTPSTPSRSGLRTRVRTSSMPGWYFFKEWLHANWRPRFKASTYLDKQAQSPVQATVKVHGVFRQPRIHCIFSDFNFTESRWRTAPPPSLCAIRAGWNTRQGISPGPPLLLTAAVYRGFDQELRLR